MHAVPARQLADALDRLVATFANNICRPEIFGELDPRTGCRPMIMICSAPRHASGDDRA